LVVGIMGAAVSAGQLVFFPLLTAWAVTLGWRTAATFLALICLAALAPVLVLLRDSPARMGLLPLGGQPGRPLDGAEPAGVVMRRALPHPTFWLLALTFYVCGASSNGDRKSTRLNSRHVNISYAVSCSKIKMATAAP